MRMCYLMKILCLCSTITCIYGNIVVISGSDARIQCNLGVKFPAWNKDGSVITISGTLSVDTVSFPRISYDSDNETLILTGAQSSDEGVYTCSLSGSSSSTTVSVLTFNPPSWPDKTGGFCSISAACQTGASVKWSYIFITKKNEEKEMKCVNIITNTTGCSPGKEQLSTGFDYKHNDDFGCLKVKFKYDLLHSTTGDTSQASGTSELTYCVLGCCAIDEVFDYIFIVTAVIAGLTTVVLGVIYWKRSGMTIMIAVIIFAAILLVVEIGWFILLRVEVLPVLPEGDCLDQDPDPCKCGHPIAFAVVMALFTCAEVAVIGYIIYLGSKSDENLLKKET